MSAVTPATVCGTFTRARRYPLVIARVWGRRLTVNFAAGAAGGLGVAWLSRPGWQHGLLADRAWLVYGVAALVGGAFLHRGRLDGRAPLWTVYAVVTWLATELPRAAAQWVATRAAVVTVPRPPAVTAMQPVAPLLKLWVAPRADAR